jgi:hypothetical protein
MAMLKLALPLLLIALIVACSPAVPSDDLNLDKPVIDDFNINPSQINAGDTALIKWSVTGSSDVTLDPDIGNMPSNGSIEVNPVETTVYTLKATNEAGTVEQSLTVTVLGKQSGTNEVQGNSKLPTVPVLLSPRNGAVFSFYPRTIKFKWQPSKGETPITYVLKIQYDTRERPGSFQGSYEPIILSNIEYTLDFVTQGNGRWCVMAKNEYGASNYCDWWYFQFTK